MYYFALFFILQLNTIRSNAQELTCFEAGFCVGSYVDGPDVLDANACLNACKSTPDCSWFSFDEFDARCFLSRDCLGMDPSCANSGCVYGQAQCDPLAVNTYTVGTNVNLTRVIPCTIIQSPNFPSPYPTDLDVISVIFFPDPPLEATSMTFLDAFDVNGNGAADCAGEVDKVVLTQCDERGDADGQLGKFCTSDADPLPVVRNLPSPENGVKVRFRSFSPNIPGLGFRLEICAFNQSTTTSAVTTTSTSSTSTLTASTTTTPVTSGGTSFTSVSFTRSVDNAPEEATDLLNLTPGEYVEHYFRFEYVSDPLDDVQATGVDLNGVSLVAEGQIGGITQVYPPLNSATSSFTAAQSSSELLFEVSYPSDGASNIEGPYRGLLQDEHGQVALASNPIDIQAIIYCPGTSGSDYPLSADDLGNCFWRFTAGCTNLIYKGYDVAEVNLTDDADNPIYAFTFIYNQDQSGKIQYYVDETVLLSGMPVALTYNVHLVHGERGVQQSIPILNSCS